MISSQTEVGMCVKNPKVGIQQKRYFFGTQKYVWNFYFRFRLINDAKDGESEEKQGSDKSTLIFPMWGLICKRMTITQVDGWMELDI